MELTQTADFESADDIALADKMNRGRQQIIDELKKFTRENWLPG